MTATSSDIDFKTFDEARVVAFTPRVVPSKKDPSIKYGRMDTRYNHAAPGAPVHLGEMVIAGPLMHDTRGLHVAKKEAPATTPFGTPPAQFGAPQYGGQFGGQHGGQYGGQFGGQHGQFGASSVPGAPAAFMSAAPSAESKEANEVLDGRCLTKEDSDAMVRLMDCIKRVVAKQVLDSGFFAQQLSSVSDKLGFIMAKFSNLYWVDMDGTKPVEGVFPSFRFKHRFDTRYVYPDDSPVTLSQMRKFAFDFYPRFHVSWVYITTGQIAIQKYLASATIIDVHEQTTVAPPTEYNAKLRAADPLLAQKARESLMRLQSTAKAREETSESKKESTAVVPTTPATPTSAVTVTALPSMPGPTTPATPAAPTSAVTAPTGVQGAATVSMASGSDLLASLMQQRVSSTV